VRGACAEAPARGEVVWSDSSSGGSQAANPGSDEQESDMRP
jgi:hypothetical protein